MIPQIDWSPVTEEEVLRYCIGQDYEYIPLSIWDDRIRHRTGLDVTGTNIVVDTLHRLREFYMANVGGKDPKILSAKTLLEEFDGQRTG